jgi:hypothetical protein
MAVVVGLLVILSPVILGRLLAVVGWPVTPVSVLLVAIGFTLELLAWASGFGAILGHAFSGWRRGGHAEGSWRRRRLNPGSGVRGPDPGPSRITR